MWERWCWTASTVQPITGIPNSSESWSVLQTLGKQFRVKKDNLCDVVAQLLQYFSAEIQKLKQPIYGSHKINFLFQRILMIALRHLLTRGDIVTKSSHALNAHLLSLSSFLADLLSSLLLLIPLHLLIFSAPIFYSLCHLNLCWALSMLPILYSLPLSLQCYEFAFKHCANSLTHNDTTAPQI